MEILLVNDDGYDSVGIKKIYKKLKKNHLVHLVAPLFEQSAKSHSFTLHHPLRLHKKSPKKFALHGSPADCTYLGLTHLFPHTELVISGINLGANLGTDVYYSGTLAGAREGALQGRKAIAFSVFDNRKSQLTSRESSSFVDSSSTVVPKPQTFGLCAEEEDAVFSLAAQWAVQIIEQLLAKPWKDGLYWNVNFPLSALLAKEIPTVRIAPLGRRRYHSIVEEKRDPRGKTYYWIGGPPIQSSEDNSDCYWCEKGYVTLTPLLLDCTDKNFQPWLDQAPIVLQ